MNNKLDFVLKNYQLFYNLDCTVNYDEIIGTGVNIVQSVDSLFFENKNDINPEKVVWKEWKGVKIPFCFDGDNKVEIISQNNNQIIINYDIIASAFYFLSGWNEYVNQKKDNLGRVSYEHSMVKKLNICMLPVVNYYFDILSDAIKIKTGKNNKKVKWQNNDFSVSLTHDIDTCYNAWVEGSFSELKKMHLLSIPVLIYKHLIGRDEWFNFERISDIEKNYNAFSSFYFLPRKGKIGKLVNADYNIKSKKIQNAILFLKNRGHDIGVHGSFGTHDNVERLKEDISKINVDEISGNRFHFLMFDANKSVEVLEKSEIKYDTSLGFAEHIGFRRGTCYPFYLYNFAKDVSSDVLEIPLIVMDSTLQFPKYMGVSQDDAVKLVFSVIDEIKKFNGVFTILWHNTFFSKYKYTGWQQVYINVLDYCKNNNGLLTNGKEIFKLTIQK